MVWFPAPGDSLDEEIDAKYGNLYMSDIYIIYTYHVTYLSYICIYGICEGYTITSRQQFA